MKRIKKQRRSNKKNKQLKKISLLIAFIVVCFVPVAMYVFALSDPHITVSSTSSTVSREDEVVFSFDLTNEQEYNSIQFEIDYDPNALEYVKSNIAYNDDGMDYDLRTVQTSDNRIVWTMSFANSYQNNDASLGTITFKVKDTASGNTDVSLKNVNIERLDFDSKETTKYNTTFEEKTIFVSVPVESSSLATDSMELDLSSDEPTGNIIVNYSPSDTTDSKEFTYTSNDEDIVKVDDSGKVTAVGIGNTTIDVTAFGNNYTVNVNVIAHIKSISLDETNLTLNKKDFQQLTATINPTNTTDDKTITWESSNQNVATVSDGLVTAVGGGDTVITAKTINGLVATCNVHVDVPMTNATLVENNISLEKGISGKDEYQLTVEFTPTDTTDDKTITWESDDQSVATVSNTGLITAVGGGNTMITGKVGKFTLTANVEVTVPITDFKVNKESVSLLPTQTEQLITTITPVDTTEDTTITWESTNNDVATVQDGLITAIGAGTTTITGKLANGETVTTNVKVLKPIENVIISQEEVTLYKDSEDNSTTTLSVTILPEDAEEDKTVTWTSNKPEIAKVDNNGKVTAVGAGEAIITGKLANGKTVQCKVTVEIPITEFKVTNVENNNVSLERGKTFTVETIINPTDTTEDKTITWTSSKNDVATVQDGLITAIGAGSTTITGKLLNGMEITFNVEVIVPIESIVILGDESIEIKRGVTKELTATINPTDTTEDTTITWTSSDNDIASISPDGIVTALKTGETTITAQAGTKTDIIKVKVIVPIEEFLLTNQEENIVKGNSITLVPTINPTDTTEDTTITWTSDNKEIATVDENGKVTALKQGTTTITGTLKNGMKVECKINVTIIPVDSISLNETKLELTKGEGASLNVIITPTNATETEAVTWTSSDKGVAIVSENGVVKAISKGTATIKATMGTFTATAEINVTEIPLESIEISNEENTLTVDSKLQLSVKANPTNTTDEYTLTYKSSDESIATVDENGIVTGLKAGNVTITVTASNGIETTIDLTIEDKTIISSISSPKTGVTSIIVYIVIGLSSIIGIGLIVKKKLS